MRISRKKKFVLMLSIFLIISGILFWQWGIRNDTEEGGGEAMQGKISNVSGEKRDETSQQSEMLYFDTPVEEQKSLSVPWGMARLPEGDFLITERSGRLSRVSGDGSFVSIPLPDQTFQRGESGLLGIALHPNFSENQWLYLYQTQPDANMGMINRVLRFRLENNMLSDRTVIMDGIPGAMYHDGGRIAFGPDGYLYITTGDATRPELAQDLSSLAGKILRVTDDGGIPQDNPFDNAIYSYGHRNPQGLAWDENGQLWSTEHGRSGVLSGYDELNRIVVGGNYGWPDIQGDETREGMIAPVIHSSAEATWAPGGLSFVEGFLVWGGLRGQTLYTAKILENEAILTGEYFISDFGRLRTTWYDIEAQELYLMTSNADGRNREGERLDQLLRIPISLSL